MGSLGRSSRKSTSKTSQAGWKILRMRSRGFLMKRKKPSKALEDVPGEGMPFNWRRSLLLALDALARAGLKRDGLAVLVGSYAHGTALSASDVDVLVLYRGDRPKIEPVYGIHVQLEEVDKFRQRLLRGDDYAVASVKFGKVVSGRSGLWNNLRHEAEKASWPDWRDKMGQADRRARLARGLLETGDADAACEEYLVAATQVSRGLLLRRRIYPLSRPQLTEQLRSIGETRLASDLLTLLGAQRAGAIQPEGVRRIGSRIESVVARELAVHPGEEHGG
ncbi:MAG: nucleotidyltransferase domain-containing protein [Candidatus Rokuibacteriota bacterium]